jgi:hypothetical protein
MGTARDDHSGMLTKSQVGSLLATFHHIDGLLADIEDILDCAQTSSVLPQYLADFDAPTRDEIERQIRDFRAAMVAMLEKEGIRTHGREISALHAIASTVDFIELAIDDLRPERMRGYGEVSEASKRSLEEMAGKLAQLTKTLLRSTRHASAGRKKHA